MRGLTNRAGRWACEAADTETRRGKSERSCLQIDVQPFSKIFGRTPVDGTCASRGHEHEPAGARAAVREPALTDRGAFAAGRDQRTSLKPSCRACRPSIGGYRTPPSTSTGCHPISKGVVVFAQSAAVREERQNALSVLGADLPASEDGCSSWKCAPAIREGAHGPRRIGLRDQTAASTCRRGRGSSFWWVSSWRSSAYRQPSSAISSRFMAVRPRRPMRGLPSRIGIPPRHSDASNAPNHGTPSGPGTASPVFEFGGHRSGGVLVALLSVSTAVVTYLAAVQNREAARANARTAVENRRTAEIQRHIAHTQAQSAERIAHMELENMRLKLKAARSP
jgi:hypothetical protein